MPEPGKAVDKAVEDFLSVPLGILGAAVPGSIRAGSKAEPEIEIELGG